VRLPLRYGLDVLHVAEQVANLAVVHEHVHGVRRHVYPVRSDHVRVPDRAQHFQFSGQELSNVRRSAGVAPLVDNLARHPSRGRRRRRHWRRPESYPDFAVRPVADGRAQPVTVGGQRRQERVLIGEMHDSWQVFRRRPLCRKNHRIGRYFFGDGGW